MPRQLSEYPGDPKPVCGNCEHFKDRHCHNGISGKWGDGKKYIGDGRTTTVDSCQHGFYPCTTRWPLAKRIHDSLL